MIRTVTLDELERIHVAGVNWRPIRRALGITAFGINGFSADAGQQLVEPHDETGGGSGHHEELYLVLRGRATFTVDGEEIEATAGALVFVSDPASSRAAVATDDGTFVVVVGGAPGSISPSPWEHYFAASAAVEAGDPARAYEIAAAGLTDHPDHPSLHYNLACFAALAGQSDRALDHLRRAFELDPQTREWAESDADLDGLREHPDYPRSGGPAGPSPNRG